MDLHFNSVKKANRKFYSMQKTAVFGEYGSVYKRIKEKHQKVGILQGAP